MTITILDQERLDVVRMIKALGDPLVHDFSAAEFSGDNEHFAVSIWGMRPKVFDAYAESPGEDIRGMYDIAGVVARGMKFLFCGPIGEFTCVGRGPSGGDLEIEFRANSPGSLELKLLTPITLISHFKQGPEKR